MSITIYAACDYAYFYEHGVPFIKSCNKVNQRCLIHLFANLEEDFDEQRKQLLIFLTKEVYPYIDSEQTEIVLIPRSRLEDLEAQSKAADRGRFFERRAFFASIRFMLLDEVVSSEYEKHGNGVLVVDIDSFINKKISIPKKYDMGLFLRLNEDLGATEYEKRGMKIAAGAVYVTEKAHRFTQAVSSLMRITPKVWFCDQEVLYRVYSNLKDEYEIKQFDNSFLDWEFDNSKASIYTGKGDRKNTEKYKKLREKITE